MGPKGIERPRKSADTAYCSVIAYDPSFCEPLKVLFKDDHECCISEDWIFDKFEVDEEVQARTETGWHAALIIAVNTDGTFFDVSFAHNMKFGKSWRSAHIRKKPG